MTMAEPSYHSDLKFPGKYNFACIKSITRKKLPVILELGHHTMRTLIQAYIIQKAYCRTPNGDEITDPSQVSDPSQFSFNGFSEEDMNKPEVLDKAIISKVPLQLVHNDMERAQSQARARVMDLSYIHGSNTVMIKELTGKEYEIKCEIQTDTVAQLKIYIADSKGIPEDQQRIIYKGKQLEDNRLLKDYDIKNGDDIIMVLRLRGGMLSEVSGRNGAYLDNTPLLLMTPTWFPDAKPVDSPAIASAADA